MVSLKRTEKEKRFRWGNYASLQDVHHEHHREAYDDARDNACKKKAGNGHIGHESIDHKKNAGWNDGPHAGRHRRERCAEALAIPCLRMAGIRMDPTAAISAEAAPVTPEQNIRETMVTMARPPGKLPTTAIENRTNRMDIPAKFIRLTATMNMGMARRTNTSTPENILAGIMVIGTWVSRM